MSWIDDIMANAPPGAFPWLDDLRDSAMRSGVMQGGPAPEAPAQARPLTEADIGDLGGEGFSRRAGEGIIGEAGARRTGLRQAIRGGIGRDVRSVNAVDVEGVRWFRDPRTGEAVPFSRVIIQPPYPGSPALTAEQARNLDTGGAVRGGIAGRVPTGMFPMSGSTIRSVSPLEGKSPEEVARLKAKAEEMLRAQEGAEAQALPTEDFLTIKALAARGAGPDVLAAAMAGLREKRQNEIKPFMLEMLKEEAAGRRQERGIAAQGAQAERRALSAEERQQQRMKSEHDQLRFENWQEHLHADLQRIEAGVASAIDRGVSEAKARADAKKQVAAAFEATPLEYRDQLKKSFASGTAGSVEKSQRPVDPGAQLMGLTKLDPELLAAAAARIGTRKLSEIRPGDLSDLVNWHYGVLQAPQVGDRAAKEMGGPAMVEIIHKIMEAMDRDPEVARMVRADKMKLVESGLADLLAQHMPAGAE